MKSFESWKFHFCYSFPLHKHRSLCNTSRIFAVTQWDRRCFQRWVFRFNYLWNFEIRTPGSLLKQREKWLLIVLLIFSTFFVFQQCQCIVIQPSNDEKIWKAHCCVALNAIYQLLAFGSIKWIDFDSKENLSLFVTKYYFTFFSVVKVSFITLMS